MEWIDITSYTKGDTQRIPRTYKADLVGIVIILTRHIDYPDSWLLRCSELYLERDLETDDIEVAKEITIGRVKHALHLVIGNCERALQKLEAKGKQ